MEAPLVICQSGQTEEPVVGALSGTPVITWRVLARPAFFSHYLNAHSLLVIVFLFFFSLLTFHYIWSVLNLIKPLFFAAPLFSNLINFV